MAIKTVLDTTDGLDEALIPLYVEKDGKFILDLEGVDDHPDVANLRNAYSRTKDDREKAKRETTDLKARIAEIEKGNPDTAATQAKLSALEGKLAEAEARANDWQGKYTGVTRDQSLQGALQQVGITEPAFLKAASVMLSGQVKLGDDGTAYVETQMGPKVLGDYVKSWAAGEGAAFVSPAKGGGANGGDSGKGGGKTIAAADTEKMSPQEKAAFYKANPGVKVI